MTTNTADGSWQFDPTIAAFWKTEWSEIFTEREPVSKFTDAQKRAACMFEY